MVRFVASVVVSATFIIQASVAQFPGWQGLRVIEQKGRPTLMRAADLDGDGRAELIVVNTRSSRLDIYAWQPADSQQTEETDASRPNDLPLAPDVKHEELQLEHVPRDVLVADVSGDGQPELVVLVSSPNQVIVYHQSNGWQKQFEIDLLAGAIPSRRDVLLLRKQPDGGHQLLVSMENGIQQLAFKPGGRTEWFTPRESRGRLNWWLADLDGDGQDDVVEQTRESNESIRWYQATADGSLSPAATLHDRSVKDAEVMRSGSSAQVVLIDGIVSGILRRYKLGQGELAQGELAQGELGQGEPSPFGMQRPLALKDEQKAVWCGMRQGNQPALVVADSSAPRLLCYGLDEGGWHAERSYPALTDIQALAPLSGKPGTLLMWTKDAADLRVSRWDGGRLTYPEPWPQSAEIEDRKILALDTVGPITWWAQKVGKDLDLYVARPNVSEPEQIRFAGAGTKSGEVLWIGGERVLLKETHGRGLKLLVREGAKARATSPTHLRKATLDDFKLFAVGDELRLGRLTDGVLQWLGDDLRSNEQIMLPQGQELADYVVTDQSSGWALQSDSSYVHQVQIDDSRLSQSVERVKVGKGLGLVLDPVLGMLLLGSDRVTHLSQGQPQELTLVDVTDERVGRAGGIKKTLFHRLGTTDIDGDGYDDLILFDDLQHRLTALGSEGANGESGSLVTKISWPVFDDKVYPYSDDSENLVREPRTVLAADFDGDQLQDLAILSHDRLLLYFAREKQ